MTQKEFEYKFNQTLDSILEGLAGSPDIDVKDFYGMVYFLENLAFFSPVLYGLLENNEEDK